MPQLPLLQIRCSQLLKLLGLLQVEIHQPDDGWDSGLFALLPFAQRNGKFFFIRTSQQFNYLERELSWENIEHFAIQAQLSSILYKQLIKRLKVRVGCLVDLRPNFLHAKYLLPKLFQLPK